MKTKNIKSLVMGLIGSIISLIWGFSTGFLGEILLATQDGITTIYVLGWLCFAGSIVGIIGASKCNQNLKSGAIMLLIATITCSLVQIYIFIKSNILTATTLLMFKVIICFAAPVLLILATIYAFISKSSGVGANPVVSKEDTADRSDIK